MNYGYTTLATDWSEKKMNSLSVRFWRALLFFIPRSNPDNEKYYPHVTKWLLEINEQGIPVREVGINKNNKVLFASPNGRNFGFWTDSGTIFTASDLEASDKATFEAAWLEAKQNA